MRKIVDLFKCPRCGDYYDINTQTNFHFRYALWEHENNMEKIPYEMTFMCGPCGYKLQDLLINFLNNYPPEEINGS